MVGIAVALFAGLLFLPSLPLLVQWSRSIVKLSISLAVLLMIVLVSLDPHSSSNPRKIMVQEFTSSRNLSDAPIIRIRGVSGVSKFLDEQKDMLQPWLTRLNCSSMDSTETCFLRSKSAKKQPFPDHRMKVQWQVSDNKTVGQITAPSRSTSCVVQLFGNVSFHYVVRVSGASKILEIYPGQTGRVRYIRRTDTRTWNSGWTFQVLLTRVPSQRMRKLPSDAGVSLETENSTFRGPMISGPSPWGLGARVMCYQDWLERENWLLMEWMKFEAELPSSTIITSLGEGVGVLVHDSDL
jgi:hypothetical protein